MSRRILVGLLVLLLLLAAGWVAYQTSIASATPATVNVTVTASDFKYDPATIRVKVGQTVHLSFKNASSTLVHELRMKPFVETKVGPGLENTESFVASAAGTYKFRCLIPGHEGMVGEFIVE